MRLLEMVDAIHNHFLPKQAIVITFDDGYVDNFSQVLPLLESFQIPATVFVTAGYVDTSCEFWWDQLDRILLSPIHLPESLSINVEGQEYHSSTKTKQDRQQTHKNLKHIFRSLPSSTQNDLLKELAAWADQELTERPEYRVMTRAEIFQLSQSGLIDVGAHTVTHEILPRLSKDEQYYEIKGSRQLLELITANPIYTFAYPNGDFNDETIEIVKATGFWSACTTEHGSVYKNDDLYRLKRCAVNDWDIAKFRQYLYACFNGNI
jgi:peptidoglycan/xylan/chitin deacetylase (PgdA/CDA1 family)